MNPLAIASAWLVDVASPLRFSAQTATPAPARAPVRPALFLRRSHRRAASTRVSASRSRFFPLGLLCAASITPWLDEAPPPRFQIVLLRRRAEVPRPVRCDDCHFADADPPAFDRFRRAWRLMKDSLKRRFGLGKSSQLQIQLRATCSVRSLRFVASGVGLSSSASRFATTARVRLLILLNNSALLFRGAVRRRLVEAD